MANTSGDTNIWLVVGLVVGPIVAALFGAVLGGFIREWWVEKFYRPKLYILGESVIQSIHYSHYRIVVRNNGKRAAENCAYKIAWGYRRGEPGIIIG